MRWIQRIKNIWKLSEFEPGQPNEEYKTPGTQIAMIVKKPEAKPATFVHYEKESPIQKIINEP